MNFSGQRLPIALLEVYLLRAIFRKDDCFIFKKTITSIGVTRDRMEAMQGPHILVRTMSATGIADQYGNHWQYQSRSDRHSKVACWSVLFDLLNISSLLRQHIESGKVVFGINHQMHDYRQNRKKDLDLVLCTPRSVNPKPENGLSWLSEKYEIKLSQEEKRILAGFPAIKTGEAGSVLVALEAKACMTAHGKSRPRLYDELSSSHQTIHGDSESAIAVGLVMINTANTFLSPGKNAFPLTDYPPQINQHKQPKDALTVLEKILELPRSAKQGEVGYDALGVTFVGCKNDGSPVHLESGTEDGLPVEKVVDYEGMIHRISSLYATRFAAL